MSEELTPDEIEAVRREVGNRMRDLLKTMKGKVIARFALVFEEDDGSLAIEGAGDPTEIAGLMLRAAMFAASHPSETRQ